LTQEQFHSLYEELCGIENRNCIFLAGLQGIDLNSPSSGTSGEKEPTKKVADIPLFGDPTEYDNMPSTEKAELTSSMLGSHKNWVKHKKV